ncbi:MAG TPA: nucleoside hydrolase [Caldilineaceae bacterium]|nr:nucleoside hydrolase [Caldilineaceae bacterium]
MQPNYQGRVPTGRADRRQERASIKRGYNRPGRWRAWLLVAILAAAVANAALVIVTSEEVHAQGPRSLRVPRTVLEDQEETLLEEPEAGPAVQPQAEQQKIIIDTDPGVDDATALIWLLSQQSYPINPLAIVTVAGNTTLENATRNAQFILSLVGRQDIPVVPGATEPLEVDLSSTVKLIHGPDGLWFTAAGFVPPSVPPLDTPAAEFYCNTLEHNEEAILVLTLGPLTNLANAIQTCPYVPGSNETDASGVNWTEVRIVSLGGAFAGGNQTPVAEFNMWQDPEAAKIVLESGAQVTLVLADAFSQFTLSQGNLTRLANTGASPIQAILPALQTYLQLTGGPGVAALPDPVAAMAALDPSLASSRPALVRVVESEDAPDYVRGQTIMAFDFPARLYLMRYVGDNIGDICISGTLLNDACISRLIDDALATLPPLEAINQVFGTLFGISAQTPDNAMVVTDIQANKMRNAFLKGLATPPVGVNATQDETPDGVSGTAGDQEMETEQQAPEQRLYLPLLPGQ